PVMTAVVVAFRNKSLIADEVLPRVPVGKKEFKYSKHTFEEGFTIPSTLVGRKSKPNQVEFSSTDETASCEDYGLDDSIPQDDITHAPANFNPLNRAAEGLMDLILLDREVRAASLVFDATKYHADNKVVLAGADQFNDFVASDPIEVIMDCLDSMIMRANVPVFGRLVFSKIIRHPKVLKAIHGNSGDSGIATRRQIAELFELEDVLVGEAFLNTAKKGETAALSRVWGKHAALIYRDRMAGNSGNRTTFGFTAEYGSRIAGATPDANIGLRGGQRVRVGETVKELITSDRLGYFIQNAIA
ncbi:MAG TPA: phage capsid protein, partial [Candidatus Riflebacteria bacterium]|nr:phage capsid protein [Candidatus Riflebacteria bacterium]